MTPRSAREPDQKHWAVGVVAFLLLLVAGAVIWLNHTLQPEKPSAGSVPATPIDLSAVPKRGLAQEWKPSGTLLQERRPAAFQAPDTIPEHAGRVDDVTTGVPDRASAAPRSENDHFPPPPRASVPSPAVAGSVDLAVLPGAVTMPSERSAITSSRWRAAENMPVREIAEMRQRIARGEKIAQRVDRRPPGPLDAVRARKQE